jgi:hypothetical protein
MHPPPLAWPYREPGRRAAGAWRGHPPQRMILEVAEVSEVSDEKV